MSRTAILRLLSVLALVAVGACDGDPIAPPDAASTPRLRAEVATSTLTPQVMLAVGTYSNCGLKRIGTLACWGLDAWGVVSGANGQTGIAQVSTGYAHTCALRTDGTVACWGNNDRGQLNVPAGLANVVQVSASDYAHSCVVNAEGTVACWGYDSNGQATVPAGLTGVVQVTAGGGHNCVLKADGTVSCWGNNEYGQSTVPAGLVGVTQVSAGAGHTCARTAAGSVVCWGHSDLGQATVPAGLGAALQVSAGGNHSCAVKADGTVACWGNNSSGQSTPPTGLAGVTQVGAAGYHSCALKGDGTVACWGNNEWGQLNIPVGLNLLLESQTITFASTPPDPALLGGSYTVSATGGGSGNPVTFTSLTPAVCPLSGATVSFVAVGTCSIAADQAGNTGFAPAARALQTFAVVYDFGAGTGGGFVGPVSSTTFNSARAGQSVPVMFDLGGDRGLLVIASGYPKSIEIACPNGTDPVNVIPETTVTAGASGLTYDATTGRYSYVWKTDRAWSGTCRQFVLKLADNSEHPVRFDFTR